MMRSAGLYSVAMLWIGGCSYMSGQDYHYCAPKTAANALAGYSAARDLERRYGGLLDDDEAMERMEFVGHALTYHATHPAPRVCSFHLLNSDRLGAFSLADGRIYITQGLYDYLDEDELLAAVIAHELAHVWAGDGERSAPRTPEARLIREVAADRFAARIMFRAGWSPSAIVEVLEITRAVQPPGYCDVRIAELRGR
jgi:predicted Zn-dependent protease